MTPVVEAAMTGRENLEMVARLFGQNRRTARASAAAVLARLSLDEVADRLADRVVIIDRGRVAAEGTPGS
ncbi:hypothetical protein AB0C84_16465 [Actinomadura sp. NPDC048955]|uniref:hypothetical protein n=1 Tax=Actinomadura sp. NPDC048955 TaxID=3158228 RepID=UPI003407660B